MDRPEPSNAPHSTHGPERASTCYTPPRIANVSASPSCPQQSLDAQVVGGSALANIFHTERASSQGHSPGETHTDIEQCGFAGKSDVVASPSCPQHSSDAQVVGGYALANIFRTERASSQGHSPGEHHSDLEQRVFAEKSEDTSEDESGQCPLRMHACHFKNCSGDNAIRTKSQDDTHKHNGNDIRRAMLPVDGSVELLEFQ